MIDWCNEFDAENWNPAEFGALTDSDIDSLTKGVSPELIHRLRSAATQLLGFKCYVGDITPWQTLMQTLKEFPPRWVTVEFIDSKGFKKTKTMFVNRGCGNHGLHTGLVNIACELFEVLEQVGEERARNKANGSKGGREPWQLVTSAEIANYLKRRNYVESDSKGDLVEDAMAEFGVKKTKITDAIRECGLSRPRTPKRK